MGSKTTLIAALSALLIFAPSCSGDDGGETDNSGGATAGGGTGGGSGGTAGFGASGGSAATGGKDGGAGSGGAPSGGAGGSDAGGDGAVTDAGGKDGSDAGACVDPGPEPNDSIVLATSACAAAPCEIGDCNDKGSKGYGGTIPSVTGVIGPNDVDHFKFDGKDSFGLCSMDPKAKSADSGFRLCLFAACKQGSTKVTACPSGVAVEVDGVPGCCRTAPGEVGISHDCTGSVNDDDSARITIRVDQASACKAYTLDFHF